MEHKKTIFVVDDDPGILEVVTIILSEKGYTVVPISDSKGLFTSLKKQTPNLIFLDIWISGSDGREITKKLKSNEKTQKIPIVIVSALNETEKIAKEVGADDFLEKPFEIDNLLKKVQHYLT